MNGHFEAVLGLTGRDLGYEPFLRFAVGVRAGLSHGSRLRDLLRCLNSQEVAGRTLACERSAACEVVLGLTGRDLRYEPFLTFAVGVRAGLSLSSRARDLLCLRCLAHKFLSVGRALCVVCGSSGKLLFCCFFIFVLRYYSR